MPPLLPLPHSPLNHFLKSAKARLSQQHESEDAIYVITSESPSLDQIVAVLSFAYLQTQLQQVQPPAEGKKNYIPVVHTKRAETLGRELPELALALQASLIDPQNLTFLDDQEWRTANAYGRNKEAIVVGAASSWTTAEAVQEWQEVQGMNVVGLVDLEANLTLFPNRITVHILAPKSEIKGVDPDTGLSSLVALHFKAQLTQAKAAAESAAVPEQLADLLLGAILIETDNLAESKSSYLDQGAVGYLVPRSSFRETKQEAEPSETQDDQADAYPTNFPDLDSFYRALKSAARGGAMGTALAGIEQQVDPSQLEWPTHFEWNLITGSLLPLIAEGEGEEQRSELPDFARKAIVGDFADLLTSATALRLLQPYGTALGRIASLASDASGGEGLDLSKVSIGDAVASQLDRSSSRGELLCIAIAALHAFVQINWTGPDLPADLTPSSLLRSSASDAFPPRKVDEDEMEKDARRIGRIVHRASLEALVFKGEPAYHLCQSPFFLVFAKDLLEALSNSSGTSSVVSTSTAPPEGDSLQSLAWWRLRASTVHSHVLDEPVTFGKKVFDPVARLVEDLESKRQIHEAFAGSSGGGLTRTGKVKRNPWAPLSARLILERGVALQRLGNDREASEKFVEAAKINGLRYQLSGALGKRTKFQKEDKTQLVLLAKSVVADGGRDEDEDKAASQSASQSASRVAEGTHSGDAGSMASDTPATDSVPDAPEATPDSGWQAKANPDDQVAGMPATYSLNDDLLLEQTKFTATSADRGKGSDVGELLTLDPNKQPPLAVLDQCTLLALCLNIRNTQPTHGLTSNQMSSFISRVISHPRNWMVHTMSLLLRARLEAARTRTVERSVLQLQALIDQMPTNDSSLQERLRFFHALDLPPKWEMQAELARRYASIGVTRSALEIYERIELWEEVVQCLATLGRQQEGLEVIRDLLQGSKVEADVDVSRRKRLGLAVNDSTAQQVMFGRLDRARESKLWCLLGDLEPASAEEHYSRAWTVSRSSSARAARSLGGYHFARSDHPAATKWLRRALKINPLYTRSWFVLGCSFMRLERWKDAATCFRRCTALDEEDGESWNNLASSYLRMSEAQDAVDVEKMGSNGLNPNLLEGVDEDDEVEADLDEAEEWSLGSDGEELSDRGDSGVELSTDDSGSETETETETETDGEAGERAAMRSLATSQRRGAPSHQPRRRTRVANSGPSYNLKLLAHRSLGKALKYAHDNWRVWYNYMIVSVDVGLLADATRAMARTVEIQTRQTGMSETDKEKTVDLAVLQRLVDAVVRHPRLSDRTSSAANGSGDARYHGNDDGSSTVPSEAVAPAPQSRSANEGYGLYRPVRTLFDETLLTRISTSSPIWTLYATLLEWHGENAKAITAHLNAFRASTGRTSDDAIEHDPERFRAAAKEVESIVAVLKRLGPRPALELAEGSESEGKEEPQQEGGAEVAMKDWKFQARSLVRTFVARTREEFEDEEEWRGLKEMGMELR